MTSTNHRTVSAADIVFPDDPPSKPAEAPAVTKRAVDMEAVLHDVYQTLGEYAGLNQNERLVVALKALIAAGVNAKPRLIVAATHLGFKRAHVAAVVGKSEGDDPCRHLWQHDGRGGLSLHGAPKPV